MSGTPTSIFNTSGMGGRAENSAFSTPPATGLHSRSPFRTGSFAAGMSDDRRRSSSRLTGTSTSSLSRPTLTSRPVLLWTHEPPNFSTHELVLNPDLIAAFGGVSDGSELLEVRLPETSSTGNPITSIREELSVGGDDDRHNLLYGGTRGGAKGSRAKEKRSRSHARKRHGMARTALVFKASQAVGDLDCIERSGSQLQLSISKNMANIFHFYNRCEVQLSKVARSEHTISHIEVYFRDQYVGRADMWRLVNMLEDSCVYVGQRVSLAGCVRGTIGRIFINEKKVMSGYVGSKTRAIFRSESAKYNVFIQMASEMWDFDEDGELYYEKALSGFLPDLIKRWRLGHTTHVVSIILFARVHYDESELHMLQEADLPLRREEGGKQRWFIDYYKVMVDLESDCDWPRALMMLKEEFFRFRHDILLLRRPVSGPAGAPWLEEQHADLLRRDRALLAGTLSASHEGNILEAINLALNPFDEHYIDRDLNRTGLDLVVLSAGTGHFDVDKKLLRLTTERLIDNGIGLDLVCLTKMPLHSVPLFHFQSQVPSPPDVAGQSSTTGSLPSKRRKAANPTANAAAKTATPLPDPLYFDPKHSSQQHIVATPSAASPSLAKASALADFYSIPHWVDCSFYNLQQDKPFRADRFVPRCKMHEVQMLGLMENEISDIALPYIDFAHIPGVVATPGGQNYGRSNSQSSFMPPFSSSGSIGRVSNRNYLFSADYFGDISGLGKREQRRLLRGQFDKEQFRDLEDVPSTFRPLLVQGMAEKSVVQLLSTSPPQVRPSSQTGAANSQTSRDSTYASSPNAIKFVRSLRNGREASFASVLASHEEQPDYSEIDNSPSTTATKEIWNPQFEAASPHRKRIDIKAHGPSDAPASTSRSSAEVQERESVRISSRAGSIRSVDPRAHPLLSDMGKAKALVAASDVTFNVTSSEGVGMPQTKATEVASKAVQKQALSTTEVSPEATKSEKAIGESSGSGSTGYSWLWSTFRRKAPEKPFQDDKEDDDRSPRQASLKIQAMLKGDRARSSSSTTETMRSPLQRKALPFARASATAKSEDETSTDEATPGPISIPSQNAMNPQSQSTETTKRSARTNSIPLFTDADGQPLPAAEHEALEQELEEREAKLRYAQQAQVEKQTLVNPSNPRKTLHADSTSEIMRWQHAFPRRLNQHVVKWRSMTTPACLPLTTFYIPTEAILKSQWQEYPYQMSVSSDLQSFLVKRAPSTPPVLAVLREMTSQRLAQGYQFIVPLKSSDASFTSASAMPDNLRLREPWELFQPGSLASGNPIFLSITNQIHRIHFDRSSNCIHVKRYVRRIEYDTTPMSYACCVWARNLPGYQTVNARFRYPDFAGYNWTHLDAVIAGHSDEETFTESTRYWRTRFVVVPSEGSPQVLRGPSGEQLSDEEVRLAGMDRLADLFSRARWRPQVSGKRTGAQGRGGHAASSTPLRFIATSLDPAMSLKDENFMRQVEAAHDDESRETESRRERQRSAARASRKMSETSSAEMIKMMYANDGHGLSINDRLWNKILYKETFSGIDFVTWLCQEFIDVNSREEAVGWGQKFIKEGVMQHVHDYHGFLDGHYFYRITHERANARGNHRYSVGKDTRSNSASSFNSSSKVSMTDSRLARSGPGSQGKASSSPQTPRTNKGSRRLMMSRSMIIDVDPGRRSDRAEVAFLHYDLAHNPANGFNFQIHWLGSTARFIEDLVQTWTRTVERYGLRLIEAPINQIKDVAMHNPFQAPLPITLALHPPPPSVYSNLLPDHAAATHLFEYALLRKFGFILDQEASDKYRNISKEIIIDYRSRPNHFDYSQFVHRSGVAFVQVLPANGGFLWLDNRLFNSHLHSNERQSTNPMANANAASASATSSSPRLASGAGKLGPKGMDGNANKAANGAGSSSLPSADRVRKDFIEFCSQVHTLEQFYKDVLDQLQADDVKAGTEDAAAVANGTSEGGD